MIQSRSKISAVTLIEMMVGVVILGVVLSGAYVYLTGYLPRQRLNTAAQKARNFLVRAKERAKDGQELYCLEIIRTPPVKFNIYKVLQEIQPGLTCPSVGDPLVDSLELDMALSIPNCSTQGMWGAPYMLLFTGGGKIRFVNTSFPDVLLVGGYQVVISSSELASGEKSREVEIRAGWGKIEVVPRYQAGVISGQLMLGAIMAGTSGGCYSRVVRGMTTTSCPAYCE